MANAREEQLRNNRRLARQILGVAVLVLLVIGLGTVLGWVVSALRLAFDDSDERRAYEEKLYGLVMFDALPFEDASKTDPAIFRQAAIWGTLYQIENRDGNFDAYERDEESGSLILPKLEVDTYLTNLLGPDFAIEDGPFSTAEFNYGYSEEKQGYLVPVTSAVGLYLPKVESIARRGDRTYVTMGYVPTMYNTPTMMLTIPTDPTKYMEYVFEQGANRGWYLVALQESARLPSATPAPTAGEDMTYDPQAMVEGAIDQSLLGEAVPAPEGDDLEGTGEGAQGEGEGTPTEGEGAAEGGDASAGDDTIG